ncbi:MAG TPA: membrane dipeptidase [Bacillota bacterium]|nr:membrane dipeptidase [Bacillota bacterium]
MLYRGLIIDGHCDAPSVIYDKKSSLYVAKPYAGPLIQVINTCLNDEQAAAEPLSHVVEMWSAGLQLARANTLPLIKSREDLGELVRTRQSGLLLGIEGADSLQGSLAVLEALFTLGYRLLGLTWNRSNSVADGVGAGPGAGGLTPFGRQVVEKCFNLGIVVDLAHLAPAGFREVLELATGPVVVSHANCHALCGHRRNLTDQQLKAVGQNKGLVGITFVPDFLRDDGRATLSTVLDHVEHALQYVGEDGVAFGSDFDGVDGLPEGIEGPVSWSAIAGELEKRNFSSSLVDKLLWGNWARVLLAALPASV